MSQRTVTRTLVTGVGDFVVSRRRELAIVGGLLLGSFALVALAGSHATDPTLFTPGPGRVENPCGPVGAHLAWLLFELFGIGAWALVAPLVAGVLALAGRGVGTRGRWVAAAGLIVALLGLLHLAFAAPLGHPRGGLVGAWAAEGLRFGLGTVGAAFVLLAVALFSATVVGQIRWSRVARRVVERAEQWAPRLAAVGLEAAHRVLALSGGVVGAVAGLFARVLRAAGVRSGRAVQRMGASLGRGLRATDPDDWEMGELPAGLEDEIADDFADLPTVRGGDTVVEGAAALVEVQWEPTEVQFEQEAPATPSAPATPTSPTERGDVLEMFPDFAPRDVVIPPPELLDETDAPLPGRLRKPPPAPVGEPVAPKPARPVEPPGISAENPSEGSDVAVHRGAYLDLRVPDDGKGLGSRGHFDLPALKLLDVVPEQRASFHEDELRRLARVVEEKLASFRIGGQVTAVRPGPVVTIFEFEPEAGIKVSRISALADDLAMALKALRVRIVAPIPGRGCVGIEIPSERRLTIYLREILASDAFKKGRNHLPLVVGKDVGGAPVVADLAKMPHLLIGGTTGSGKSVGVNGMLMGLLFCKTPAELRLLLIDPKMLEFELYDGIPHLLHPVVTEPKGAAAALQWACREMDRRYAVLAHWGTRNIRSYNKKVERELADWTPAKARKYLGERWEPGEELPVPETMPYIVIVIDELADLMMVASKEVEEGIVRLAQKARACGIHLIVATQRPSVDVITGLIKANLPTRISFQLRTKIDSRTVLDQGGAEALLGRGDLLYLPPGVGDLQRCHGAFVSDEEVARVTEYLRHQGDPEYVEDVTLEENADLDDLLDGERDELYDLAVQIVIQQGKASTSMIQRHLKIGYNRAARMIDIMEAAGIVGPADGARPRDVLVSSVPEA